MATILVNGNIVDPAAQQKDGVHFAADAAHSDYILLHCVDRLENDQYDDLKRLEVTVLQYFAGNTYLCKYLPAELGEVRSLPFVVYANVYHPHLVVDSVLKSKAAVYLEGLRASPDRETARREGALQGQSGRPAVEQLHEVYIILHPECARSPHDIKSDLAQRLEVDPKTITAGKNRLLTKLRPQDFEVVAHLDEVQTIEELPQYQFLNDVGRQVLRLNIGPTTVYWWDCGQFSAAGEVVAVADSGCAALVPDEETFGETNIEIDHPAFELLVFEKITYRQGESKGNNDYIGHGTHVAASVLGSRESTEFGLNRGTAPDAILVFQTIQERNKAMCVPRDGGNIERLFREAYLAGARIHTNSWGSVLEKAPTGKLQTQKGYTSDAVDVDTVMKDLSDLVILVAAGNDGWVETESGGQIDFIATAKNAITVGSTESARQYDQRPSDVQADPTLAPGHYKLVYDPYHNNVMGNPNNVSATSSKGPIRNPVVPPSSPPGPGSPVVLDEGRCKPDVVAPGVSILSARSQDPQLVWQDMSDRGRFVTAWDFYGRISNAAGTAARDDFLIFSSGTSMATPLVAGCCAVLRRQLRASMGRNPIPAALVKAVLINGATDLRGRHLRGPDPIRTFPDNAQGFGRVNMEKSIRIAQNRHFWVGRPLRQGEEFSVRLPLRHIAQDPDSTTPRPLLTCLTVTMCYTDLPGTVGNGSLVNWLTLKVIMGKNTVAETFRYGNTGNEVRDRKNNVQKLFWKGITGPEAVVVVKCEKITKAGDTQTQDFALAWEVDYMRPRTPASVPVPSPPQPTVSEEPSTSSLAVEEMSEWAEMVTRNRSGFPTLENKDNKEKKNQG